MDHLLNTLDHLIELRRRPDPTYPKDHSPVARVPDGGSSCASCRFLGEDRRTCRNRHYIRWHGNDRLPYRAERFCSDWWEER